LYGISDRTNGRKKEKEKENHQKKNKEPNEGRRYSRNEEKVK